MTGPGLSVTPSFVLFDDQPQVIRGQELQAVREPEFVCVLGLGARCVPVGCGVGKEQNQVS